MIKNNKTNKKNCLLLFFFFFFFFFLFSLSFISAQASPHSTNVILSFPEGLEIVPSPLQTLKINGDYRINFFLYNTTNGLLVDNSSTNCTFYMADDNGELIVSGNVDYTTYWNYQILGGNFSYLGDYKYGISCQADNHGGAYVGSFDVTPSGQGGTENTTFFIFIILLIYGITFFGFFGKNIPITILGGMAMMFLGVYLINQGVIIYRDTITLYIAYLTIGIGAITSIWAILEQLEVI